AVRAQASRLPASLAWMAATAREVPAPSDQGVARGVLRVEAAWYTPAMLAAEPNSLFVFGDNLQRRGRGGQAAIRDAANAVGLPTKRAPRWDEAAFFTDADLARAQAAMAPDVA